MFSVGDRVVVDLTGLVPVSSTGVVMEVIKGPPLQYRVKVLRDPVVGAFEERRRL